MSLVAVVNLPTPPKEETTNQTSNDSPTLLLRSNGLHFLFALQTNLIPRLFLHLSLLCLLRRSVVVIIPVKSAFEALCVCIVDVYNPSIYNDPPRSTG